MPIKLYVDLLLPDNSAGVAMKHGNVAHNILSMNRWGKSAPIYSAGKYICFVHASDENTAWQIFIDAKADPSNLQEVFEDIETVEGLKQKVIAMAELVNSNYENVKDKYIMVCEPAPDVFDPSILSSI